MDLWETLREIEAIVATQDRSRINDLIDWLSDEKDGRIPWAASWALAHLQAHEATPALEALLRRDVFQVSESAARALLRLGPDDVRARTVDHLMAVGMSYTLIYHPAEHERLPEAIPIMEPFTRAKDERTRHAAETFIGHHSGHGGIRPAPETTLSPEEVQAEIDGLTDGIGWGIENAARRLADSVSLPPETVAPLLAALTTTRANSVHDPRQPLAVALARTGDPAVAEPLYDLMEDMRARGGAAWALEILLERSGSLVNASILKRLADMPNEQLMAYDWFNDIHLLDHEEISAVSMRRVKELARNILRST